MEATVLVPEEHIDSSVALAMAVGAVAQFLSTYLADFLRTIFHKNTLTAILPSLAVIVFAVAVIEIIYIIKTRRTAQ